MTVKYKTVITRAGAEKLAAATLPNGKKVNFAAMAVGDGGGKLPEPDASQTKLVNEVWRHALNKISQDKKHKNYVVAELVIPPETGGFWLREMGLYDDTGTLIAVGNMAESYKPELAEGSGRAQTLRMVIMVSDIDTVELSIDTTLVMATQDYVDDKLAEHEQSRRHPDATLKEKGFTQLSSATDSTSEELAATPKAVKAAHDLASGKYTAQDASTARKGIVKLSNEADSVSEELAATPKAVKIAMDNANARLSKDRNGSDIPNTSLFVQNIGLKPTVDKAANAVQKNGDTMTGSLTLSESGVTIKTSNGDSPQYSIQNIVSGAEFNADLLGAEVRIFGKGSGAGQTRIASFNLNNGDWSVPGYLRAGAAAYTPDGSVYGTRWSGWLHDWLSANFSSRDNNINTRATWDWVNQNFVSNVRFGAVETALVQTIPFGGFNDQVGYVLTGLTQNDGDRVPDNVYRRTLQIYFPSRGWFVVGQ
ncbi:phage tail protein [Citrobacter braakii]|uniref:phage tail-collar fiber domain-containing protein n=1 Tax=Citrobacter braakii TaxID=57706 RepID=UPI00242A6C91|nr:phage tail protein [Citrobacter braakii]WFW78564.1 phage tail protein [Citrobacter braakii]